MTEDNQKFWNDKVQMALADEDFLGALEALVRGYQHEIVGFCMNMLGNRELGIEVAQEVFLAAYTAFPRFRQEASLRTWLFAIARNLCRKTLRDQERQHRKIQEHQEAISQEVHASPPQNPDDALQEEEKRRKLASALHQLGETNRALLLLRYDKGLSIAEIANIFGISIPTVCRRISHALQQLRKEMSR